MALTASMETFLELAQLLFGIKGKRWDGSFANYDWYGTKDWVRPIPEEVPQYNSLVEGGCYW